MKVAPLLLLFLTDYASSDTLCNIFESGCIRCGDDKSRIPFCKDCKNCYGTDCHLVDGICKLKGPTKKIYKFKKGYIGKDTCDHREVNKVKCGNHCRPTCELCNWQGKKVGDSVVYTEHSKEGWCGGQESNCEWYGTPGITQGKCVHKKDICTGQSGESSVLSCDECPKDCDSDVCVFQKKFQKNKCINRLTDDTRTASANLKEYEDEFGKIIKDASWYFQQVRPVSSVPAGTYYSLQIPKLGYIGIQNVDDSTGLILFSVWDNDSKTQVMLKGDDMDQAEHPELGGGTKLSRKERGGFPVADTDYYLALQISDGGENTAHLMGYIYLDLAWKFLGKFKFSGVTDTVMEQPLNFIENWSHVDTKESRKGAYGPLYYVRNNVAGFDQGIIRQAYNAKFVYNEDNSMSWSHERVNAHKDRWKNEMILETGGNADATENNRYFKFEQAAVPQQFKELMMNAWKLEEKGIKPSN